MPRISIQQFRAIIARPHHPGAAVRAYRELGRRPELATGVRYGDWPIWNQEEPAAAST